MNTPTPVKEAQPVSAVANVPSSLAAKVLVGGAPLATVLVWALQNYGHATFSPVEAAAIGSVGASAIGYVLHVGGAVVGALLKKIGVTLPSS